MNLKILNGEHFILSADGEKLGNILFFYSPSRDAIVVNDKAPLLEELADLMATYLDMTDRGKKMAAEYTQGEAIRSCYVILDRIARIRRKLYRSMKR